MSKSGDLFLDTTNMPSSPKTTSRPDPSVTTSTVPDDNTPVVTSPGASFVSPLLTTTQSNNNNNNNRNRESRRRYTEFCREHFPVLCFSSMTV